MNKELRNALFVALAYVGVGTLGLIFIKSGNILIPFVLLITIPVTFVGFGIAYTESDSTVLILVVQLAMLLITWRILYGIFRRRTKRYLKTGHKL
jgi:hypothetical protein